MHTRDGNIVHQCLSGNTEAFALLVDKYKERIFALVYAKVGQFQDAEDLTQDIFLNAYKKLSTLRRWDNFYPWLYSIAANRCKNFYRAQKEQVETMNLLARNLNHQAAVDADSDAVRVEQLHEALASLPEMHRQVLVLRYMAGMKSKEIAQTLRVSPNTIDQRLVRARAKLKTVLSEEMIPMIRTAFAERRLQPGFTARVVELVSNAKIQSAPHKTALPLGLSAAGGVILLLLSLSLPHSPLYPLGKWLGGSLPLKTQVVEDSDLPVDAEVTRVAILGAEGEDGDFGQKPAPLKTPAATGQAEDSSEKKITVTAIRVPDDLDLGWDIDISPDGTQFAYMPFPAEHALRQPSMAVYPLAGLDSNTPVERKIIYVDGSESVQPAQPKWSPNGKLIAFYRREYGPKDHGHYDVCLIPASGGKMRFLAHTDSEKYDRLSWSPDSKELAYVKMKGKKTDIWIVSLNSGAARPFTTDGKENTNPSWSPDGEWIFYSSKRGLWIDSCRVWRQPVAGGKAVVNERVGLSPPIHSPDGKWIAYTKHLPDGQSGFIAARVSEQGELVGKPILLKAARLQVGAKPLRWTPDGKIIVLQEDYIEKTYAFRIKSGEKRHVNSNSEFGFEKAQWLSDGSRLLLVSNRNRRPGFFDIESGLFTELPIERPEEMFFGQSTLSPDEKWAALVQLKPKETDPALAGISLEISAHLHIMPVGGGTSKKVAQTEFYGMNPRWSPDGQKIAFINANFAASAGFESKLCVASVSDSQVKTFTDTERCMGAAWSPDGTMLAYLRLKGKGQVLDLDFDETEVDIYLVPATGGESKRIAAPPNSPPEGEILLPWTPFGRLSWTPDGKRLTFKIGGQAWVMSIDGGEPKPMRRNYIPSSWSSDGMSYLAIGRNGELQRVSLDGTTIDELPFRVPADARPLSMSPDGETILYRQVDSGTQCWSIDVSHLVSR